MSKQDQATLLLIKGAIFDMPPEEQVRVRQIADGIKKLVGKDDAAGLVALSLAALEIQMEQE